MEHMVAMAAKEMMGGGDEQEDRDECTAAGMLSAEDFIGAIRDYGPEGVKPSKVYMAFKNMLRVAISEIREEGG